MNKESKAREIRKRENRTLLEKRWFNLIFKYILQRASEPYFKTVCFEWTILQLKCMGDTGVCSNRDFHGIQII